MTGPVCQPRVHARPARPGPALGLGLLLLIGALAEAAPAPPSASPIGSVDGRVFQRGTIVPLAGARVQSGVVTVLSDGSGRFHLTLPAGPAELVVTRSGFQRLRVPVQVRAGTSIEAEVRLLPEPAYRRPFEAVVRGAGSHEGERFTLRGEEVRTLPGTLGDPFRAVGLLPGVATPLPVLPIYVIRGASPGMNGFFLDGMRVPQLFHLLVGGGVVHARLVDQLDLYPGAYDATLGHYAGGVIDAKTRPAKAGEQHGEMELRLYDVSGATELSFPGGSHSPLRDVRLTLSGHYGYPGPLVHLIDKDVDLSYWDYQLRLDWHGLTVQALGSYDSLTLTTQQTVNGVQMPVANTYSVTFHRVQVRAAGHSRRLSGEAALVGGYDDMTIFQGYGVSKLSLAMRARGELHLPHLRLSTGLDGELSRFTPAHFNTLSATRARPDDLGELGAARDGIIGGLYVSGTFDWGPLTATLGARADVYHTQAATLIGLDPRVQVRVQATDWLSFHAAGGVYQQPPSFPVPLPGIDTFALQLGLQRAIHAAVGEELRLPAAVTFGATGYYERFSNMDDVVFDPTPILCTSPPPLSLTGYAAIITRQVNGASYGMELLLRRTAGRFTGWVTYTLSRTEREFSCGLGPADYDQTHVLNVVAQVRLPWNMMAGARFFYSTGRPVTILTPPYGSSDVRNNARLPDTVELDLRVDREWIYRKWALSLFLEVLNTTYSLAAFDLTYPKVGGVTLYNQPQLLGFNWILPSIGARGRF